MLNFTQTSKTDPGRESIWNRSWLEVVYFQPMEIEQVDISIPVSGLSQMTGSEVTLITVDSLGNTFCVPENLRDGFNKQFTTSPSIVSFCIYK